MSNEFRTSRGGRIKRDLPLRFRFNGGAYVGYQGDTLASALLANGIHHVATSIKHGRPRGIMTAGVDEPNALVQVEKPFLETMLPSTSIELRDGLEANGLSGQGRQASEPDPARYDTMHAHCDVLVVGAGPAGLAAALSAARSGARVILADGDTEFGGSLLGTGEHLNRAPAIEWVQEVVAELHSYEEVRQLPRTTVLGSYDDKYVVAIQHQEEQVPRRRRAWRISTREVVLATGSLERPLVFSDNDRPGTMLAGSARTYLHRFGVRPGNRAVVFTTNDSAYAAALDLHDAGVEIATIVDAREAAPTCWTARCIDRGVPILNNAAVVSTAGDERITSVHIERLPSGDATARIQRDVACDLLLISGGWDPAAHLHSQARGSLCFSSDIGSFVPVHERRALRSAGAAAGLFTTAECLRSGAEAGTDAARGAGFYAEVINPPRTHALPVEAGRNVWQVPNPVDPAGSTQFVDLARDTTVADIRQAIAAGLRSVEQVKRHIGVSPDQGETSGILATGVIADALGLALAPTTFLAPYAQATFGALAGRDQDICYDPVRVTAMHDWHVAQGAPFDNVGQWTRPQYYPLPGENTEAAVLREFRAVRNGVGIHDLSPHDKIEVQGPDTGEFLDFVYTSTMSTLKLGRIRYGLMCKADGTVFDEGTVMRTGQHRYLITTTPGNAAGVLEWLEGWLQTERSHLQVYLTTVTEQWATIALVGPRSREVLTCVAPEIELDDEDFPSMSWRTGLVAGRHSRVCRINFSSELSFEINVPWWYGREVWEALIDAGAPFNITPCGTETMHLLRAETGFPVTGGETATRSSRSRSSNRSSTTCKRSHRDG